jgi:hypothetical protein
MGLRETLNSDSPDSRRERMRAVFTMTEYPDNFYPSDRLKELLLKCVAVGVDEFSSTRSIQPVLVVDTPRGYELVAFPAAIDEQSLRTSAADRLSASSDATGYTLYFEGVLLSTEADSAVVVVEGAEVGMQHGYRLFGFPGDNAGVVYHGLSEQLFGSTVS